MEDLKAQRDRLLTNAADCELIANLATDRNKRETFRTLATDLRAGWRSYGTGDRVMIAKDYFARQATTLMRMAKSVKDPQAQAALATKAADLRSKGDDTPSQDTSPWPDGATKTASHLSD
jgi:hypothetical protein